ncbi:hypothetical protein STEG23_005603 [Scotinomys teguina]
MHFGGKQITYEVGVQEVMALYRGHTAEGRETKYMDMNWGLGGITLQLTPGIDCPNTATFLDAIHYYDTDSPVLYQQALCIFEMPKGVPLGQHFNSNFRNSFSSYARLNGPMLVLRTTSTTHNHDYIWGYLFHPNGMMEGKMYQEQIPDTEDETGKHHQSLDLKKPAGQARPAEEQDKGREKFPEHVMSAEPNNHDNPQDTFCAPMGLEILVDYRSTAVQDWRVEQLCYNGKFYNSPEALAQKYADGEVGTVILEDPLSHAEFPMSISKIFSALFTAEGITYEIIVRAAVALYGGHTPAGTDQAHGFSVPAHTASPVPVPSPASYWQLAWIQSMLEIPEPRCPSTEEWIRKMWYIYTMEYYAAEKNNDIMKFAGKWMELENVILSEVRSLALQYAGRQWQKYPEHSRRTRDHNSLGGKTTDGVSQELFLKNLLEPGPQTTKVAERTSTPGWAAGRKPQAHECEGDWTGSHS